MSIKIQNKSLNLKKQNNIVLFVNSNHELKELNNSPISRYAVSIKEMLNLNKKKLKDFLSFDLNAQIKVTIIKITKDQKIQNNNDKLGAKFFEFIKTNTFQNNVFIDANLKSCCKSNSNFFNEFLSGILIKSYDFDNYKTKKIIQFFKLIFMEILKQVLLKIMISYNQ